MCLAFAESDSDSECYADRDSNRNGDCYAECDTDGYTSTPSYAQAAAYPASSADSVGE